MKSGGGKRKGSAWERDVAKMLSLWITEGKSKDVLWRSQSSGGRATVRSKTNGEPLNLQLGDLTIADFSCEGAQVFIENFVVEAKNIKQENWWPSGHGINKLFGFWEKLNRICVECKRHPLLIVKINNNLPMVFLNYRDWKKVERLMCNYCVSGVYIKYSGDAMGYLPLLELIGDEGCKFKAFVKELL